jgi:hypothetical protein
MTDVYVIRNQFGHYWGKSRAWVSGSEPKKVLRAKHEDEAINTLFELSSKDVDLRGSVVGVELSERAEPIIEASTVPLPSDEEAPSGEPEDVTEVETSQTFAEEVR